MSTLATTIKVCRRCGEEKSAAGFHKNKRTPSGLVNDCRQCVKIYGAMRYAANKERIQATNRLWYENNKLRAHAYIKQWRRENPARVNVHTQRRYARKIGSAVAKFTPDQLAERWAYYGGLCWMCGAVAVETDHVKPLSKGGAHMLCNLRPACRNCNAQKSDTWPMRLVA